MKTMLRTTNLLMSIITIAFIYPINVAEAAIHHKHHHGHHHYSSHTRSSHVHSKHSTPSNIVKTAQQHLIKLGYLSGQADGVMGPKTTKALIHFQSDHGLKISGKLTTPTYNALVEADLEIIKHPAVPLATAAVPDFYANNPDFYGHYNQEYANPMMLAPAVTGNGGDPTVSTQTLHSRFAKIDVSENTNDNLKTYTLTLNGQLLLQSVGQPSVIGISRTFELPDEDAIIFTSYRPNDALCNYKHYLFTIRENGQNIQEIGNCTRGFQGQITNNSLYIIFPEPEDGRNVGSTWRYENGDLERL